MKKSLALTALLVTLLAPADAHARRRGIGIINTGDNVSHVGDVAQDHREMVMAETGSPEAKVGYLYKRFGLFWVNVWTWDGKYCLYDDSDTVWELDQEQAANLMGVTPEDVAPPFVYKFPPGLPVLLALGGFIVFSRVREGQAEKEVQALLDDSRYQRALSILQGEDGDADPEVTEVDPSIAFERAVASLTEAGVPREEAQANLSKIVAAMSDDD